jgi:hypothetical protein
LINQKFINYSCRVNNIVILKELKILQNREAERQKRDLEQLRSYLTASAPQQGIDSHPRNLSAQSDDQGINLNNEISVSME